MNTYYKSFVTVDHQLVTMTYEPELDARKICQSLDEVLDTEVLKPNTRHSQARKRLCASLITSGYTGTYRPEGLVFTTGNMPDYAVPFDMMALTSGETFTSADYYHGFLPGFARFKFRTVEEMLKQYPNSEMALKALNSFREKYGLDAVNARSMNYNECCFEQEITIHPLALIGQKSIRSVVKRGSSLVRFNTVQEYLSFFNGGDQNGHP